MYVKTYHSVSTICIHLYTNIILFFFASFIKNSEKYSLKSFILPHVFKFVKLPSVNDAQELHKLEKHLQLQTRIRN